MKLKFKAGDEDPLVYPDEFKKGMKEELEHTDVTGGDKEMTKKIVLAHLKEDPKYYSKLSTSMKAERDFGDALHPINQFKHSMRNFKKQGPDPGQTMEKQQKNLPPMKAKDDSLPSKKFKVDPIKRQQHSLEDLKKDLANIMPYSGEEEFNPTKGGKIMAPVKAEEEEAQPIGRLIPHYKPEKPKQSQPMHMTPQQEFDLKMTVIPNTTKKAEEEKKLSTKLIEKAEELCGKDKVKEAENQAVVEKFSEEIAKPARFTAEPK